MERTCTDCFLLDLPSAATPGQCFLSSAASSLVASSGSWPQYDVSLGCWWRALDALS